MIDMYVRSYGARCNTRRFIMSISGTLEYGPLRKKSTLMLTGGMFKKAAGY
jgi:hypothetical protein